MPPLHTKLRNRLEDAVKQARRTAEAAARMLPQIFRPDDPVLQVGFAPEHKRALENLVTELPVDVFTAEDSLGWVYQFWQADRKDEVNKSGDKITGETLPAVTQLFTEHYMVLFLLHNTIGAWWAGKTLTTEIAETAETEEECRKAVSLPGYEFTYLRFVRDEITEEESTAENTENKENILKQDSASAPSACSAVKKYRWRPAAGTFPGWPKALKDFRLLDPCCGSGHFLVAAFVLLALLRMRYENLSAKDACDAVIRENLHGLELDPRCTQIAAFALALTAWKFTEGFRPLPPLNIACSGLGVNARKEDWLALADGDTRLRSGLEQLYDLFQKAPELGSLINPRQLGHGDLLTASFAEIQPLLTRALQSEKAKRNDDLNEIGVAAQGMASAAALLGSGYCMVATNVPYLKSRKQGEFLKQFCERCYPDSKADIASVFIERLSALCGDGGTLALVTPQHWRFLGSYESVRIRLLKEMAFSLVAILGPNAFETISGEVVNVLLFVASNTRPVSAHCFFGVEATEKETPSAKADALLHDSLSGIVQADQLRTPDARITFQSGSVTDLLNKYADCYAGIQNGDAPRFQRMFWEIADRKDLWHFLQATVPVTMPHGGREMVILYDMEEGHLREKAEIRRVKLHDSDQRGNQAWNKAGVVVSQMTDLQVTLYTGELYDQSCAVILPHDQRNLLAIWSFCSSPVFNEGVRRIDQKLNVTNSTLVKVPFDLRHWRGIAAEEYPTGLPKPGSDDPTQWLFAGHPSDATAPLQVGVARLLGHRWPRQAGQTVSSAQPVPEDGLEKLADEDGIVCIPSVRGEAPAAERLRALLAAAFGKDWTPGKLDELLSALGYAGSNLEDWLRNGFFDQHCKMFHHRPFIWQIWDGRKDGFSALVNCHKLDHKLLEKLTYTYLGDWIKKQQEAVSNEESGADDRLLKAQQLQDKLKLILEGEAPYDIFVRWKTLDQQPIGWNPDLNDGVRLNIRPFMTADILRKRPNIKWGIDRGKNPPGSPWGEERNNDKHLTLAEKRAVHGK
jgi:hypothetical protein